MKLPKHFIIVFSILFFCNRAFSQNIMLNVITQNAGIVKKNKLIFFEVTISNTSSSKEVPIYKLKPQISFPSTLVSIPDTGHVLPKGWTILSNTNGVVILSNGTDIIPTNTTRIILIALKGKELGGPSTISSNLTFSNSIEPGIVSGSPTLGDNTSDNVSTSSIKVIK